MLRRAACSDDAWTLLACTSQDKHPKKQHELIRPSEEECRGAEWKAKIAQTLSRFHFSTNLSAVGDPGGRGGSGGTAEVTSCPFESSAPVRSLLPVHRRHICMLSGLSYFPRLNGLMCCSRRIYPRAAGGSPFSADSQISVSLLPCSAKRSLLSRPRPEALFFFVVCRKSNGVIESRGASLTS